MKPVYPIRRENLRTLLREEGGPTALAKKLGHANGSYVAQLIGPRPSREISEKVAREVELKFKLPTGWLDQDHTGKAKPDEDANISECVHAVATAIHKAGLSPKPEVYANLITLVYEYAKLTSQVDASYIQKLIALTRK